MENNDYGKLQTAVEGLLSGKPSCACPRLQNPCLPVRRSGSRKAFPLSASNLQATPMYGGLPRLSKDYNVEGKLPIPVLPTSPKWQTGALQKYVGPTSENYPCKKEKHPATLLTTDMSSKYNTVPWPLAKQPSILASVLTKSLGRNTRFQGIFHDIPKFFVLVAQQQHDSRRL